LAYSTVDKLRARLGTTTTATDADTAQLEVALSSASAFIDAWCDRTFLGTSAVRSYARDAVDPCDPHLLYVGADCLQVGKLLNGDGTEIAASAYVLEPRNAAQEGRPYYAIRLLSTVAFSWPTDGWVQVFGNWGYSARPDAMIEFCCLRLAEYAYRSKAPLTTTTIFDGSVQKELPQGFPTEVLTILDQRKRLAP
jgi:hypothetical protein